MSLTGIILPSALSRLSKILAVTQKGNYAIAIETDINSSGFNCGGVLPTDRREIPAGKTVSKVLLCAGKLSLSQIFHTELYK